MIAGLTIGSVLLGIALLLIVILYLARPFVMPCLLYTSRCV